MFNFCMLFDSNYLYKGMTQYYSLLRESSNFHLWILCKDDKTFEVLSHMNLEHVTLITSKEFEHDRLLALKKERSVSEYAWTLGSSLCLYTIQRIKEGEMITYLDGDMYFFDDPKIIFDEIGNASIAIVEHRLEGERKTLEKFVGTYNVAWVSFRNDAVGREACEWWAERVLEWCGAYFENGKIGDQHYLNDWTSRFKNVCVIQHEGADVAPWNVANRAIACINGKVYIGNVPLVFYHFHNFILVNPDRYIPSSLYYLPHNAKKYIYTKYFADMKEVMKRVAVIDPEFNAGFKKRYLKNLIASWIFKIKLFDIWFIKYTRYSMQKTYK